MSNTDVTARLDEETGVWVARWGLYISQGTTREEAIEAVEDAAALDFRTAIELPPEGWARFCELANIDPQTKQSTRNATGCDDHRDDPTCARHASARSMPSMGPGRPLTRTEHR